LRSPSEPSALYDELRHDEERDALDAFRPALDARQHKLDDVLGEVLLAAEIQIFWPVIL
jgi:hypothetical protein